MHSVLVLGGYGFFGARIASRLARDGNIRVLVGGRDRARALAAAASMNLPPDAAIAIDAAAADFAAALAALRIDLLIHTAGPFQTQDYAVARAAIAARCNYIDLADGRAFVAGIGALDAEARAAGVCVVSGASSVPALSSAVVDRYAPEFARLDAIRMGIGTGGRPPGPATMRAVLGYCGKPLTRWQDGAWVTTRGWLDTIRYRFPAPVGTRALGSCDVPDLELFPARYAPVRSVTFHAGFGGRLVHGAVELCARLVQAGLLTSLRPLAPALHRVATWIEPLLADSSAMFVELSGVDAEGSALVRRWHLLALRNHGPNIPCGAALALARRCAAGNAPAPGAYPCVGLVRVNEYLAQLPDLDLRVIAD
jgi:saccharopine dehydrogenase-like NADP-dependent oxidoreductase